MLKKFIPILDWLPRYQKGNLKGDVSAGLTVGILLIPQGMAYAMLAGMPPIYGLYASLFPLGIYALLGTSRQLSVAPIATDSLLIAAGVGQLAVLGSDNYIQLAITLALMVGAIQLTLGILRLGFLVNFLSRPVISGFTSAAAIIIGMSQLKHLLGIEMPRSNQVHVIVTYLFEHISHIHWPTFLLGLGAIFLIRLLKKVAPSLPGAVLAVVTGSILVYAFHLQTYGLAIVGDVPKGLPSPSLPNLQWENLTQLFPIAVTIAIIAFMEAISVAKALQAKHKSYEIVPNQELIALGMANITGSFFKAFPTTGGFSRSAVNDQAGAKTGIASLISAAVVALTLLFLTPLFYYLPQSVLAAIIIVSVWGLIDFKEAKNLWESDRTDFFMLALTFVVTLTFGIKEGIATGVVLSLAMVIYRSAYPHTAVLGKIGTTDYYRNVDRYPEALEREDLLVFRFDAPIYFANANYFRDRIYQLLEKKEGKLRLIILHAEPISALDSSAVFMLKELVKDLQHQGIRIYFSKVIGPVRDVFFKSGLIELIGKDAVFMNIQDAIDHFDHHVSAPLSEKQKLALQTNTHKK
ncbi:solute carrier family 26 protein [Rapidithrix thailandica]|uniref:Solute carrier family 26 protein n=1 Tax=Rapidithrix thailandica TaxID=413964 RepID=A0AAW9SG87_9BACT